MICKFYNKCSYYYKKSFICNTYQDNYCGKYREFILLENKK